MFNNKKVVRVLIRRIVSTILLVSFIITSSEEAFALSPSGKLNDKSFQEAFSSLDSSTRALNAVGESLYLKMPVSGVREMVERRAGKPSPIIIDRIENAAVFFSFRDPQGKTKLFKCFLSRDNSTITGATLLKLPDGREYWREEIGLAGQLPGTASTNSVNSEDAILYSTNQVGADIDITLPKDFDERLEPRGDGMDAPQEWEERAIRIEAERSGVLADVDRMNLMFTAYQEILSTRGRDLWRDIAGFKKAFAEGDYSRIEEAKVVIARMPDPQKITIDENDPENWINWFDLKDVAVLHRPLGYGCRQPCQQCLVGNGVFLSRNLPLPVALKAIKPHNFGNWSRNELFDWYDPFFRTSIDSLMEYAIRKDDTAHFIITTTGWPKWDVRAQKAAENISRLTIEPMLWTSGFNVSFHLGQPYYDIVLAIYEHARSGGSMTEPTEEELSLISAPYIEHYANILSTLSPHLRHIYFCYTKEPSFYNLVSTYAFKKALEKADWNSFDLTVNVTRSIEGVESDDTREFLVYQDLHDAESDEGIGRSVDFLKRLELAEKGDPACLKVDPVVITDRIAPKTKYPLVSISHNGDVKVESHIDGRILARTSIGSVVKSAEKSESHFLGQASLPAGYDERFEMKGDGGDTSEEDLGRLNRSNTRLPAAAEPENIPKLIQSGGVFKRIIKSIAIVASAILVLYLYKDWYLSLAQASSFWRISENLVIGGISCGLGMYVNQTIRGERYDWGKIARWTIAGGVYLGLIVYGGWFWFLTTYVSNIFWRVFVDVTLFFAIIGLPVNFFIHKYIVSLNKEKIDWRQTLSHSLRLYAFHCIFWGIGLFIGWSYFEEQIVLVVAALSIVWRGVFIYFLDSWVKTAHGPPSNDNSGEIIPDSADVVAKADLSAEAPNSILLIAKTEAAGLAPDGLSQQTREDTIPNPADQVRIGIDVTPPEKSDNRTSEQASLPVGYDELFEMKGDGGDTSEEDLDRLGHEAAKAPAAKIIKQIKEASWMGVINLKDADLEVKRVVLRELSQFEIKELTRVGALKPGWEPNRAFRLLNLSPGELISINNDAVEIAFSKDVLLGIGEDLQEGQNIFRVRVDGGATSLSILNKDGSEIANRPLELNSKRPYVIARSSPKGDPYRIMVQDPFASSKKHFAFRVVKDKELTKLMLEDDSTNGTCILIPGEEKPKIPIVLPDKKAPLGRPKIIIVRKKIAVKYITKNNRESEGAPATLLVEMHDEKAYSDNRNTINELLAIASRKRTTGKSYNTVSNERKVLERTGLLLGGRGGYYLPNWLKDVKNIRDFIEDDPVLKLLKRAGSNDDDIAVIKNRVGNLMEARSEEGDSKTIAAAKAEPAVHATYGVAPNGPSPIIQAETLANKIKMYASETKQEKAKVIVGIETAGWVPDEQKSDMQALTSEVRQLVDTLKRRGVFDNITVVLGNSETLLSNIAKEQSGKSDKIVVLGSEKTLTSDDYKTLEAFKACIDLRELGNLDYISLLEVLTVALNLGLGGETYADSLMSHPDIGIETIGERIVRLIPSKRIDINEPSKVYHLQIKELAKQA